MYDEKEHAPTYLTDGTLRLPQRLRRKIQRRMWFTSLVFIIILALVAPDLIPIPGDFLRTIFAKPIAQITAFWEAMPPYEAVEKTVTQIIAHFQQKLGNIDL